MKRQRNRVWPHAGCTAFAFACVIACSLGLLPARAAAEKVNAAIAIGHSTTLWSTALQEQRRLLISLPPHYAESGKSYPVLYLLDAETQFRHVVGLLEFLGSTNERIPEMIVIGVTNTERARDLTPATDDPALLKALPEAGHADVFLKYLADELIPWADSRYRTVGYRVLVGHSFGGLFNAYTLLERPEAFQAHIAISPSLWWDKQSMVERTAQGLQRLRQPPALYLSWADDEANISESTQQLVQALTTNPPPGLRWAHRYYAGEDHLSTPHRSLYDAMEWLYAGWRMQLYRDGQQLDVTMADVDAHYGALSTRYGYPVAPSAAALNAVAQTFLKRNEPVAAFQLLRRNVREFPYRPDTYRALGEALERFDRGEEALQVYEQGLRVAVDQENPYGDPVEEFRTKARQLRQSRDRR